MSNLQRRRSVAMGLPVVLAIVMAFLLSSCVSANKNISSAGKTCVECHAEFVEMFKDGGFMSLSVHNSVTPVIAHMD